MNNFRWDKEQEQDCFMSFYKNKKRALLLFCISGEIFSHSMVQIYWQTKARIKYLPRMKRKRKRERKSTGLCQFGQSYYICMIHNKRTQKSGDGKGALKVHIYIYGCFLQRIQKKAGANYLSLSFLVLLICLI